MSLTPQPLVRVFECGTEKQGFIGQMNHLPRAYSLPIKRSEAKSVPRVLHAAGRPVNKSLHIAYGY